MLLYLLQRNVGSSAKIQLSPCNLFISYKIEVHRNFLPAAGIRVLTVF